MKAAIASDALASTFGAWSTPGTGAALLVRHAAQSVDRRRRRDPPGRHGRRRPHARRPALAAGATIATGKSATSIVVEGNTAAGVMLADGEDPPSLDGRSSADPARLRAMIGDARLPPEYQRRVEAFARAGSVAKVNLALSALPRFAALPDDQGQHRATIHLVPGAGHDAIAQLESAFAEAASGRLPARRPLELVIPTAADPSLRDPRVATMRRCSSRGLPTNLAGTTWAAEEERWLKGLLARHRFVRAGHELARRRRVRAVAEEARVAFRRDARPRAPRRRLAHLRRPPHVHDADRRPLRVRRRMLASRRRVRDRGAQRGRARARRHGARARAHRSRPQGCYRGSAPRLLGSPLPPPRGAKSQVPPMRNRLSRGRVGESYSFATSASSVESSAL